MMNNLFFCLAADEWFDDKCIIVGINNSNIVNFVSDGESGEEGGGIINDGLTSDNGNENDEKTNTRKIWMLLLISTMIL